MLFDTERIYDENQKNLIAYIFCGMPEKIDKDKLPNYYSLLAGKQMLMAMKSDKCWYFSPDFPNNEKKLFINNSNKTKIKNYYYEKIEIKNETFQVFIISKDLYSNYYSLKKYNFITFISSVIFFTFILWFLERNKLFAKNSIASILRKEIFLSAIMPILTVCFVANLYIEEESNANKSELILELNQKLNELENREYYYSPLCEYYLKTLPYSKDIQNYINKIINSNDEEKNKECDQLSNYLKKNISGRMYKKNSLSLKTTDPFIVIKEIMFVGKDGWIASAKHDNKDNKRSSLFGDIISELVKTAYFNKTNISNTKDTKDTKELKGELIAENTIKVLSSGYGSNVGMKLTNLPNNILIVASSYASIGIYIGCFPSINNPDYALVALIYFDNEFKPDICNQKNESQISYKAHLASNSKDNKIYCFYSPNINVGEFFFHDGWFINHKEELETVKELGLASSWINSSYLPLSKKIDMKGKHFLEAKQGNFIKDNVYTATVSEYPIHRNAFKNIITFASIIFFSLIMISLIAQSITLDLLDPVKKLIDGAGAVSKGEYKFRTNFTRKDELGTLCFSFDKMMKGLEEKQLMNRMVSKTALKVASNLSETNSKKVDVALLYVSVPDFDIIMKKTSPFELFSK
ncbi:MAG: hypothetical protein J6Z11_06510, partial [Candidatus Riflebacteria bacterium]|nr:hypothetical protein [Candidatus Riflebacteria bacterium]